MIPPLVLLVTAKIRITSTDVWHSMTLASVSQIEGFLGTTSAGTHVAWILGPVIYTATDLRGCQLSRRNHLWISPDACSYQEDQHPVEGPAYGGNWSVRLLTAISAQDGERVGSPPQDSSQDG